MNKPKLQGHSAILIAGIIFGLNIPVTKTLLSSGFITPSAISLMRALFAGLAFWITSFFFEREKVAPKDLGMLALGGLLGITLNQLAFIEGLSMTSPVDASIVTTVTPILVMIIAAFMLKEPITFQKTAGVLIGATGAVIFILQTHEDGGSGNISGMILCFLSSLSYAFYLVLIKPITLRYKPVTIMSWMFLFATLFLLPFGIGDILKIGSIEKILDPDISFRLFFTLFAATYCTYLLIPYALQRIRPTTISMYNYVQPIVAASVAVICGQGSFTLTKGLAAVLVFLGVYFVTQSKSRADVEKSLQNNIRQ